MRGFIRRLWRYRIVITIVGIFVGAVRAAIWGFVNYSTVVALFAMISAAVSYYYSPVITGAIVAGLLTFTSVKVLAWHLKSTPGAHQQPGGVMPISSTTLDYTAWDGVDPLRLWQAACLWFEIDPQQQADDEPPVGPAKLLLTRLKQEVLSRRLPSVTEIENYVFHSGDPDWVKNYVLVKRADLKNALNGLRKSRNFFSRKIVAPKPAYELAPYTSAARRCSEQWSSRSAPRPSPCAHSSDRKIPRNSGIGVPCPHCGTSR